MSTINVRMDRCATATTSQTIETEGLDTCIGIVAYGLPAADGGINKVMAHASTRNLQRVIGTDFVTNVRNSRMQVVGICMSCPDETRNDNGPAKIDDATIRQAIASVRRIQPNQVTAQQVADYRAQLRMALRAAENEAKRICTTNFGIGPVTIHRDNAKVLHPPPYGTMVATKGPRGTVKADNMKMADIPDLAPAASASRPSSSGGRGGAPASTSRPGSSGSSRPGSSGGRNVARRP
jgi:hypothetical protein